MNLLINDNYIINPIIMLINRKMNILTVLRVSCYVKPPDLGNIFRIYCFVLYLELVPCHKEVVVQV